jgi:hypothetical protein
MSSFISINTDYSSSDSDISEQYTPRNKLLRVNTGLSLRSNTPSPPPIERRRTPLRRIKSMPICGISPRPNNVIKLIQTPTKIIRNNLLKHKIERDVRETINEIILNVEEKDIFIKEFEKSIHIGSENFR